MKFLILPFVCLYILFSARVANANRTFPSDVQFDLIFPRNETYAPTQLFPIVFGFNNLDSVWPLAFRFQTTIKSIEWYQNRSLPFWRDELFSFSDVTEVNGQDPGKHFFYTPMVNMTNGTSDTYIIQWSIRIVHRCFANESKPAPDYDPQTGYGTHSWENTPDYRVQSIRFSTAPGAQRPDVEASINSCPALNEKNSAAIRITDIKTHWQDRKQCPVLEPITPTPCAFQSSAKELAANISTVMLEKMRCKKGDWQTITRPCLDKMNAGSGQSASAVMCWTMLLLVYTIFTVF